MDKFVAFRADGSIDTGIGHIKRCLTLAKEFKVNGYRVLFLVRAITDDLKKEILESGLDIIHLYVSTERDNNYFHSGWLQGTEHSDAIECLQHLELYSQENSASAALIFVDHYALALPWENILSGVAPVFVIDDLCDRPHHCWWLMDQTVGRGEIDYQYLVNDDCVLLLGPQYALLREEFYRYRERSLIRRENISSISNILVTLGGIDKTNVSAQVLDAIEHSDYGGKVTLIVGASNPNISCLKGKVDSSDKNIELVINSNKMAEEMVNADICIGAAGTTSWERCALGLPTINLTIARNQQDIATNLSVTGAAIDFGWLLYNEDTMRLTLLINSLISNPAQCKNIAVSASSVCDGLGVKRVFSIVNKENA